MAKELTTAINKQITEKHVKPIYVLNVNGVDVTSYLVNYNRSYSINFGAAAATFVLNNSSGDFGDGGTLEVKVGQIVEFIEKYAGDSTEFKRFYGLVNQKSILKSSNGRNINLTCLDYISALKFYDIDLEVEGTKVEVTSETLIPNFLPAPNENLAQVFDFANSSISTNPLPIIMIKDELHSTYDPQYDGFEIYYQNGQLKLGSPLNCVDNYSIFVKSYHFYTDGVYIEDILEQIITQANGYDGYLFGETSAQDVIDNHLKDTYNNVTGRDLDYLTPNYTTDTITIKHLLASAVTAGETSITLDSVEGLPESGEAEISGDVFTWTSIESGNVLAGIPTSGSYSLNSHLINTLVSYEKVYAIGQVWYLTYSNLVTTLVDGDFTLPSGSSIDYVDKRFGRIILDSAISASSILNTDTNYTFKTLQATGIQLNSISFKSRELNNRFEAVDKLRDYLAPNYIIRTLGDNKIWASYLSQKVNEDYNLTLEASLNYLEDEDLYTRTKFYGKNRNPANLTFNEGVDFFSTGESYKGFATTNTLSFIEEDGDYYVYGTTISGAGYIDPTDFLPLVYLDDVPIDNKTHRMESLQAVVNIKTRTVTKTGCHGISSEQYSKVHSYYYYKVHLPHQSILSSEPIVFYDTFGIEVLTVSPGDINMDWARGIYTVPGEKRNEDIELISTASYTVFYSTGSLIIDYDNVKFLINKQLIPNNARTSVTATFEYWAVMIPVHNIASVIDGRWDTQVEIEFFTEPPSSYPLTIIDLGAEYPIQAIDVVAGFYKPDEYRKFDVSFAFTLLYSVNGVDYFDISDQTHNVKLTGGESVSFEEDSLGLGFTARYLKINLEQVKNIKYGSDTGVWVASFAEIAVYSDLILSSECKLIPTTVSTTDVTFASTSVILEDSTGFTVPDSGEEVTAYINEIAFTYGGITDNTLTDCVFISGTDELIGSFVTSTLEGDNTLYDYKYLLPKLGDRLYKNVNVSDEILYIESELNYLSKAYLKEFVKNHTKIQASVLYSPFLEVGQTVNVLDSFNNTNRNYFIESISESNGLLQLILAYYPNT